MASNGHSAAVVAPDADLVVPLQINGEEATSSLPPVSVIDPSTTKECWRFSPAGVQDAARAAEAAQAACKGWAATKPQTRRDILLKAADIIESRAAEYGRYMEVETGSATNFAAGFNLPVCVGQLRDCAGRLVTALGGSVNVCEEPGRHAMVLKEPYGVVFGIAPWNAPYILGLRAVTAALAAGNTCVLKGSEHSPRCFWAIGRALHEAGLPPGCLNVITTRPEDAAEVTTSLIANPIIKKVGFTGSTAVGAAIAEVCGRNLKPSLMELGGKNCSIVCDDADIDEAARWCAVGSFHHAGQICMCTDLILVHHSVAAPFADALKRWTAEMFAADGPAPVLLTPAGVQKNAALRAQALAGGAKLVHGDPDAAESSDTRMRPVILDGIEPGMDMWRVEAFGPTVGLVHVGSDDEALAIANSTELGLAGAVFTKDLARGLRVCRQLDAGAVHVNCMTVHDEANLPHGGVKRSGWGRFNASAGLDEFLKTKTLTWQE